MQRHLIMCALASVWLMTTGISSHRLNCIRNHHLCCIFMHAVFNLCLWTSVYASRRCDYKQMCSRCVLDITIKTNGFSCCLTAASLFFFLSLQSALSSLPFTSSFERSPTLLIPLSSAILLSLSAHTLPTVCPKILKTKRVK